MLSQTESLCIIMKITVVIVTVLALILVDKGAKGDPSRRNKREPVDASCTQKGQNGDCEFYRCFEDRRQCGSSGYLIGYGYKYCNRFRNLYNDFTTAGKNWIDCVRPCLTRKLISKYQKNVNAGDKCEELKSYAFDTHVNCYLNCGFCNIYKSNLGALHSVFKYRDMLSWNAVRQLTSVGYSCLG
ncbi:Hypothetical predicted protein [Mytilus galloprovincialis]|uniref:Stanniocalcin-like protein n=1 Tax=Mytilus galloprovincialis TaxID=29158 RepID=A0A8B6CG73_MYTGA|nr:Hypothetical predicted protein [Mytilus galloprovincialis]